MQLETDTASVHQPLNPLGAAAVIPSRDCSRTSESTARGSHVRRQTGLGLLRGLRQSPARGAGPAAVPHRGATRRHLPGRPAVAPALDPPSPRGLRRPVQAAGSREPVPELDRSAAPQPLDRRQPKSHPHQPTVGPDRPPSQLPRHVHLTSPGRRQPRSRRLTRARGARRHTRTSPPERVTELGRTAEVADPIRCRSVPASAPGSSRQHPIQRVGDRLSGREAWRANQRITPCPSQRARNTRRTGLTQSQTPPACSPRTSSLFHAGCGVSGIRV